MMTESNRSLSDLPALIAERKKLESWLSALEARRDATAPHVFDRVRTDYAARLREVDERLSTHRSGIVEERTSLESRRSLLEAEEQMRRDERTELELRAHVGELAGAESESAFGAVDDALAKMRTERAGLTKRIEELDAFLNQPGASKAAEPAVAQSVPRVDQAPPAAPAAPAAPPAQTAMDLNAQRAASSAPKHPHPTAHPDDLILPEQSATFLPASGPMPDIDEVLNEPPGGHHGDGEPKKTGRVTPGGGFDELAFLSDVVGLKTDAPVAPPVVPQQLREEPPKSPLEGVVPARPSMHTPPLASNVGNTPIVLRASGAISQSKTLKCTECGAMNYPTEWYCERCGAELAAL